MAALSRSGVGPSLVAFVCAIPLSAQAAKPVHNPSGSVFVAHARAILLATVAIPGVEGRTLREGYFTQPVVMAHARLPRFGVSRPACIHSVRPQELA
jgi:hypothetical protein